MPQLVEITDSYAPLLVDVAVYAGVKGTVRLPVAQYFQELTVEYKGGKAWVGKLILFDQQDDYLENLIFAAGSSRRVELRWGWDQDGEGLERSPLIKGRVLNATPTFSPDGVSLELELIATVAYEQVVDKKVRSFPAQSRISDVVLAIAKDRKWKSVVEETHQLLDEPLSYKDESDHKFITEKLIPQTINKAKESFVLYIDGSDTLHFHSKDYNNGRTQKDSVKSYTYARGTADGEVLSFSPSDGQLFSLLVGGGNAEYTAVDSEGGKKSIGNAKVEQGMENANPQGTADEANVPDHGDNTQSRVSMVTRHASELERIAAARYDRLRAVSFTASLEVRGSHAVDVMDYVTIRYIKKDGQDHYLSGIFRAHNITHQIGTDGWKMTLDLIRKGTKPVEGSKAVKMKKRTVKETSRKSAESKVTLKVST